MTAVKRSTLASSSAASTSSRMQNGLGLLWKMAMIRAMAVIVFSPPLSSEMLRSVVRVFEHDVPLTAAEDLAEQRLEVCADRLEGLGEQAATFGVDLADDVFQRVLGLDEILKLCRELFEPSLQHFEIAQAVGVDAAHQLELLAQPVDAGFEFRAQVGEGGLRVEG
jgi:hypothetical protein